MRTYTPKPGEITRHWHVIDATDVVLGRLATHVAVLLRGKHKPTFAPHIDTGDHVIVVNAGKVVLTGGKEGWWTADAPGAEPEALYDVAMARQEAGVAQIVIAGKEYGTGSSRDWAAKGTMLLGVRSVIAESFERIHRSNLVGMGVLPLEFVNGETRQSLGLTGFETYDIMGLDNTLTPRATLTVKATANDGTVQSFSARCRIDTPEEMQYYKHGGILPYVLRSLIGK